MVGNIFFSFSFIDEASEGFKDWISMVGGLFENMGVDKTDISSHKLILSFLTGGLLPIISLTFAHMLVKFSEQNKTVVIEEVKKEDKVDIKEEIKDLSQEIDEDNYEEIKNKFIEKKLMEERDMKYKPTQDDLNKLDDFLKMVNYKGPKFEVNTEEKINPTESEIKKLQEIVNQYSNSEPITVEQEGMVEEQLEKEEEIEKVFFNPEETEVLYSDDEKKEVTEEIVEIIPQPVEMAPTAKILNYFKRND
jgi:hypothetical protein